MVRLLAATHPTGYSALPELCNDNYLTLKCDCFSVGCVAIEQTHLTTDFLLTMKYHLHNQLQQCPPDSAHF
jgi:hypothetical protein